MHDLILKNGRIYDGSGLPSFVADLAIRNGRIEGIGRINDPGAQTIDVDGLAVAPGFVDFHTTSTLSFSGIRSAPRRTSMASLLS